MREDIKVPPEVGREIESSKEANEWVRKTFEVPLELFEEMDQITAKLMASWKVKSVGLVELQYGVHPPAIQADEPVVIEWPK